MPTSNDGVIICFTQSLTMASSNRLWFAGVCCFFVSLCSILRVTSALAGPSMMNSNVKNVLPVDVERSLVLRSSMICASNDTHIGWLVDDDVSDKKACRYQTRLEAEKDCFHFLKDNMMPFDVPNAASLGFSSVTIGNGALEHEDGVSISRREEKTFLPDGLSDGIVKTSIRMALDAKRTYRWTMAIPKHIYLEYVLNYVNVNEARTNWRPLIHDAIQPILQTLITTDNDNSVTVEEVVMAVNRDLWMALGRPRRLRDDDEVDPIIFKAGQTPLVYDPMSIIAYGYGSCTGLSIVLVNALRAAGVAARLVGTPAWYGDPNEGNHNWVEVYNTRNQEWSFLEPAYGDYGTGDADNLGRNPCQRWFCTKDRFGIDTNTRVYAARLNRNSFISYPMAWDIQNDDVPGEDRTDYYRSICSNC